MPYTPRPFPKTVFVFNDFSEIDKAKSAWATFERIFAIQVLAREDVVDGKYDAYVPHQYATFEEKMMAIYGQSLHLQAYPDEDWSLSSMT
jgi:hypothetical protein